MVNMLKLFIYFIVNTHITQVSHELIRYDFLLNLVPPAVTVWIWYVPSVVE